MANGGGKVAVIVGILISLAALLVVSKVLTNREKNITLKDDTKVEKVA